MNKKRLHGLIGGAIVIALTIMLWVLLVEDLFDSDMAITCFFTLLLSEAIAVLSYAFISNPLKAGALSAGFVAHSVFVVLLSFIFVNIFDDSFKGYWILYILSAAAAVGFFLFVSNSATPADKQKKEVMAAKSRILEIRSVVNATMHSTRGAAYQELLYALDEDLRFCDDTAMDAMDDTIHARVCELAANIGAEGYNTEATVEAIRNLIRQRNFMVQSRKSLRG